MTATMSAAPNTSRAGSRGGLTFMSVYNNLALDKAANDTAADFVREKIAEIVKDPATAKLLQPDNHPIGSKRICIDTDYFAAFNRPNVTLVDIKSNPIEEITAECGARRRPRTTRSMRWCWQPASMP